MHCQSLTQPPTWAAAWYRWLSGGPVRHFVQPVTGRHAVSASQSCTPHVSCLHHQNNANASKTSATVIHVKNISHCHRKLLQVLTTQLLLLHPLNNLYSRSTWVCRDQKSRTSMDLIEARDDGVLGCSGISWTICKQSTPCSRQITTSTPHHSNFTGRMLFLMPNQQCQSTQGIY